LLLETGPRERPRAKSSGRNKPSGKQAGLLTADERARIIDIQDLLIAMSIEHREAVENGHNGRARRLQSEIDDLLREKEEIEKWAVLGSA
jgi:hypothetical protein